MKRNIIGITLFTLGCMGGLIWAAASRIGDALVSVFLYQVEVRRMTDTHASDFVPIYCQSAALTVAACAPCAVLMIVNRWSENTPLPAVFAAVALGIAAWALGLWLLRHPLFVEAWMVGRQLFWRYVRGV